MKKEIEKNKIQSESEQVAKKPFWRKPKFPLYFGLGVGFLVLLMVVVRLLIGIQLNNFSSKTEIAESEQKLIETSDWSTYTNEGFCFEVRYPRGWEIDVQIDDVYLKYFSMSCGKETGSEKLSFWILINQYGDLGVIPTQYRYEGQEIVVDGIDLTPGIYSFNSRHDLFSGFCVDEDLKKVSPIFPACEQSSGNLYFQFFLLCEGTGWKGEEGRGRCSELFNQILSTFEFTRPCPD